MVLFSVEKTILFPLLGGLLQTPFVLASTNSGSYSSPCFVFGDVVGVSGQLYPPPAGVAKTTQFPAISLMGLGSLLPSEYGHPQIAKPIPIVNVGAT
jgi:hypothetical protein